MAISSIPTTITAGTASFAASPVAGSMASGVADTVGLANNRDSGNPENQQNMAVQQPTNAQINKAIEDIQRALPSVARNLQFSIDSNSGQTVVKVIDTSTKEVIRQIPSEEVLAIRESLDNFTGLMVKQEV